MLTRVEVNRVPKGVVGIISPWNYPFTMALCDGLPALLAGNAVVAKPDAQSMLSALLGAQLLEEAGFPADLWQVVAGPGSRIGPGSSTAPTTSASPAPPPPAGSSPQGCAERLIGCSLELGGKNPILVLRDADLEKAAEGAVRACFSNAGQLCVSMERMFVADQVYDRFLERFVARTQAMTLGASMEWGIDMGILISQAQLDTVTAHVEDAVAKGARVLTGGKPRPDLGAVLLRADRSSRASPPTWPASARRPSARSSRSTASTTRRRRSTAPTTGSTASTPRSTARTAPAPATLAPPDQVRHRQHQRGVRRHVRQHRLADGRHARVRDGPAPGRGGHPPLHRAAVGRDPAGDPLRPDVRDVRRDLRQGDDRQPAADEEAGAWPDADYDVLVDRLRLRRVRHARCG